tara:strand:+ start:561 stop:1085 length:525 start_codon:yes stop_codon:yes gene_type:complete
MKIPYKPKQMKLRKKKARYIILHDTKCSFEALDEFRLDKKKFQMAKLRVSDYIINGNVELQYHYVIEKIEMDYESTIARPLNMLCEFEDIVSPYAEQAIHVLFIGNYDYDIPDARYYKQVSYRVLAPMMSTFVINPSNVLLHSEVSTDKKNSCPGTFLDKNVLINNLKTMRFSK